MKDLVEFPLKCMNSLGWLVPNTNTKTIVLLFICELSLGFTFIVSIINYFYSNDIYEITDNMQGNVGWFNAIAKLIWCIYYKKIFLSLFEKRKGFWNNNHCATATKRNASWILNTVSFLQKAFFYQTALGGFKIPFSIATKTLAYGAFYMSDDPLIYFIVWTANVLSVIVAVTCIISFDCLFMGICYEVIVQFKILYDHLERLDVENINSEEELQDYVDKFKFYLEHHKFLLRYIQNIKDCFSVIYLIQYLTTAPTTCTFMYLALESSVFSTKILSIVIGFDALCQFALYCIPITYMTEEASKIATAIYVSNWYGKHFSKLKKATQLTIQEAQQAIRMTSLGGMVDINTETLITIVKTSFSICTVLRNLKLLSVAHEGDRS